MMCGERRENNELVCPACGLRWDVYEDKPPCPKLEDKEMYEQRPSRGQKR